MKEFELRKLIRETLQEVMGEKSQLNEIMCGCPIPDSVSATSPYGTYYIQSSCASCDEDCCDGAFTLTNQDPVDDFVSNPTGGRGPKKPVKTKKLSKGKLREKSQLNELSASSITGYFSDLTSDRGPSGVQVDDDVRSDLIGLALPAIEQTKIDSPKIATLVSNLLILKDKYDTTDGKSLGQQPEEVQKAVEYLSNKDALAAFKEITDIDEAIATALKLGANPTEKIYTASAFPDGMRDSDFYKKAVEDGYSFILKPYLNGRSAQTLPVGKDGFMINESIRRMKKLANII